ncbi:phytanoyl-CoA dioxygenase family protein [Fluoribacter gormanii]|uniref:Phytanoyl-CoA dioxygenase (PhyH) n=1 Tax=Fluoribacter gormanii TaxID=464 RepID=A0A377GFY9_9GAMM|nr:phytanoyl-CoA dioxygenase family protein [Fluoribacter gormanii]KTD02730.1 Phytanoyl-CoA dioxygenase (PhyH) [Fluoribacter gormanii]SIR59875.1 Phytanoyl-CoA dioxygenase (PhyH) [Fluoribacter gormanii]STO23747.1 Phytanoyl-CoA dioxygenase (PhyH) [Fluoribacter gormanii]
MSDYQANGFFLAKNYFDASELEQFIAGANYLKQTPEIIDGPLKYFEKSQIDDSVILNRVEKFCDYLPLLNRILNGEKLLNSLKEITGREYILFKEKINFKLSGGGGFKPHQDGAAFRSFVNDELITIIIPVHNTNENNGCFQISNQIYSKQLLQHANGKISLKGYEEDLSDNWRNILLSPGDAFFFSSFLVHQSQNNLSSSDRSCFFVTYSPADYGDQRTKYFIYKRENFPPRIERKENKDYEPWRKKLSREIL